MSIIHAELHAKSFETISKQSRQTTACAISKCTNTIWRNKTICKQESKVQLLDNKAKRSSNRNAASSYSLAEQLIAPFFAQSTP
jgi:hypothetical protein